MASVSSELVPDKDALDLRNGLNLLSEAQLRQLSLDTGLGQTLLQRWKTGADVPDPAERRVQIRSVLHWIHVVTKRRS